ncbi:hypothetical protein [Nocardioides marmoribigeumensis]|uniref:SnoaL-like domain-containing protein n=1 Tax=Nocardioides marmoribigeumensis TaxID=433649 RepID=A0ABU2BV32_9ACTN|nr:hypothetical protein [Nocardioides marmoribigeumensis]MDR7362495.1 hypothetical protein [Nocardioides marmoribigeumensis]
MTDPVETALLITVPAAEPVVGRHRSRLDRAARVGDPAHVTVVFPFVPFAALREADLAALTDVARAVPAFTLHHHTVEDLRVAETAVVRQLPVTQRVEAISLWAGPSLLTEEPGWRQVGSFPLGRARPAGLLDVPVGSDHRSWSHPSDTRGWCAHPTGWTLAPMSDTLGAHLARAIADKDESGMRALLAPEVDFRGLTPGRTWEGSSPDEVVDTVLGHWFKESDRIVGDTVTEGEVVGDTERVSYRFDLENADGSHVAEQQVYYRSTPEGDRIGYLRVLCSGFRPR